jgi:hypothetical protein
MASDQEFLLKWKAGEVLLHAADEAGAIVALGKYFVNLTNRHRITVQPHTSKEKTKGDKA